MRYMIGQYLYKNIVLFCVKIAIQVFLATFCSSSPCPTSLPLSKRSQLFTSVNKHWPKVVITSTRGECERALPRCLTLCRVDHLYVIQQVLWARKVCQHTSWQTGRLEKIYNQAISPKITTWAGPTGPVIKTTIRNIFQEEEVGTWQRTHDVLFSESWWPLMSSVQ